MSAAFENGKRRNAQTLVFFLLTWGTIMLLTGLAIDSGLLYLAKARMSRAVDGAALAAVGNFSRTGTIANGETQAQANRDAVALIMRNFAAANFTDLSTISQTASPAGGTSSFYTLPNGTQGTTYTYSFNDGTQDVNGQFRRFVQVQLNTGSGGAITSATCNARCPVQTYFIGYGEALVGGQVVNTGKIGGFSGPTGLVDLKVSSSAVATRNPRLIMVVIDRSASMLATGGGASGLPPAVVQFLDFFDTSSDNIGIVSFGSSARLEMQLTTNFIIAGTNVLLDAYNTTNNIATPGIDPEMDPSRAEYDPNYTTTGVRRLKFGGNTAADEGIRLGLEELMANAGFNDPDVVKYMVIFTDGKWNASRTLVGAPGYTNEVMVPTLAQVAATNFVTNAMAYTNNMANGQESVTNGSVVTYGPWISSVTEDMTPNNNLMLMPSLSPLPDVTNAIADPTTNDFVNLKPNHLNDTWMSADGTANETLASAGASITVGPQFITNSSWVANNSTNSAIKYYTHNFDVWLQPGSVAYLYHQTTPTSGIYALSNSYVSDYTKPTKHINLYVASGDKVDLVVPGYIADGLLYDGIDLNYPDNAAYGGSGYNRYRTDNYQQQGMWPDDNGTDDPSDPNDPYYTASLQRQLMFRNYVNLLTGFYLFRADEPMDGGHEPLITDAPAPGAPRARYGLGAYYPSAGFYWPFGGEQTNNLGYITNAVGVDTDPTYGLQYPLVDGTRHIAYSINMLSSNAAPEWYGELFYKSVSGSGTNTTSGTGTVAASSIMQSSDWQAGAPSWMSAFTSVSGLMTNEPTHNTNIVGSPSVWRPLTFNGSTFGTVATALPSGSATGGYVSDGKGNIYKNTMAWSGRPTHYFDFTRSKWMPIGNNHATNQQFLQFGNWKAEEYAWHARALGVTIYTVGYGTLVTDAQQAFLAQIANSTNTTAGGGSNITFNANQPIGQQFYATNSLQISNDFYQVGQAINAALTQ